MITGTAEQIIQWLFKQPKDNAIKYDIEPHKQKRSKSQNAYAWVLIDKIADKIRKDKDGVYFYMLRAYGQREIIAVRPDVELNGICKYFEYHEKGFLNGVEFYSYIVYRGSSEYDTQEMAVFIDGIVQEAQQLDIPTLTPYEIQQLQPNKIKEF